MRSQTTAGWSSTKAPNKLVQPGVLAVEEQRMLSWSREDHGMGGMAGELEASTAEHAGSFNGVVAMAVRAGGGERAQQGRQEPSSGRSGWLGWEKKRDMERVETV